MFVDWSQSHIGKCIHFVDSIQLGPHAFDVLTCVVYCRLQSVVISHTFPALSLSSIADAATACVRLLAVFETETLNETLVINADMNTAVKAEGASFTWDSSPPSA
jgi:hypothetical protein